MDTFERAWLDFKSRGTLDFGGHTDPDFRGDHTRSAAFVIPVDAPSFADRLAAPREALGAFPFVSLHPDYFMHISLVLLGFVEPTASDEEGEITPDRLSDISSRAQRAVSGFGSIDIRLANLGAFPSAAYIEAHDEINDGKTGSKTIGELRHILSEGCGLTEKPGPPHLTLAYFEKPDGTEMPAGMIPAMEPFREWPVGEFTAHEIHLTVLNLCEKYARPEVFSRLSLL